MFYILGIWILLLQFLYFHLLRIIMLKLNFLKIFINREDPLEYLSLEVQSCEQEARAHSMHNRQSDLQHITC